MNLSDKLWHLMGQHELTRADLSKKTGLPYTTIDSILKRKDFEKVKLSTLHALKKYFNVSLDYLICDDIEDENYGTIEKYPKTVETKEVNQQKDLSDNAIEVAHAYEKATFKEKNIVRQVLDLEPLEQPSTVETSFVIDKKMAV